MEAPFGRFCVFGVSARTPASCHPERGRSPRRDLFWGGVTMIFHAVRCDRVGVYLGDEWYGGVVAFVLKRKLEYHGLAVDISG